MKREEFPILQNKDIAYLDNGATTQKPQKVLDAIKSFYENENANPHRGAYELSVEATEKYEDTRIKISEFINARYPEEIIFSKNATESLNLLAYSYGLNNLKKELELHIYLMF